MDIISGTVFDLLLEQLCKVVRQCFLAGDLRDLFRGPLAVDDKVVAGDGPRHDGHALPRGAERELPDDADVLKGAGMNYSQMNS